MKQVWLNSVLPIAALFSFRMLGLFMLIPVFTVYAQELLGSTPTLIGLALGSYGLSQGILQMPFGWLSDRIGRKPVLFIGLALFVAGSLLGAYAQSIYTMILARTLQGMGAIGSVLIALLADLTPDEQRTKAMAVIGSTIGLSFSLAMVISPALTHTFGLSSIFYFTAILAILGLALLYLVIPTPQKEPFPVDPKTRSNLIKEVFFNVHLQRLNLGIFCQHLILTATFYVIPLILKDQLQRGSLTQQWHFYLPLMIFSFILMIPFLIWAEKKRQLKSVFVGAVFFSSLCQFLLSYMYPSWLSLCVLMLIYFIAFNILEASLPSLISRQANQMTKGTAMGLYSSSQFLGIFAGGAISGLTYQGWGISGVFYINALCGLLWLIVASYLKPYAYQMTVKLNYSRKIQDEPSFMQTLKALTGVQQVAIKPDEGSLYLRVDKALYQQGSAEHLLEQFLKVSV